MVVDQVPEWKRLHTGSVLVDLHAHPSLKVTLLNRLLTSRWRAGPAFDPFSVRTDFDKLRRGGVDVLLSTVYPPEKGILEDCCYLRILRYIRPSTWRQVFDRPYFDVTLEMLDSLERQVDQARDPMTGRPLAKMVRSVKELDHLLRQTGPRPIAVINNVEGAHSLDGNLDSLQRLFDRGVAYLTLAHFYANEAVNPCFPYPKSVQKLGCFQGSRDLDLGLEKPFGVELIERMIDLGIIVDVTHCTPVARKQIYDIVGTRLPIIASHVGAYAVNPNPYNLEDWEIRRIADTGGLVGVIFMNYWLMPHEIRRGVNAVARTIDHLVRVGGIDHVAIGSDFDGFTDPPDDLKDASEFPTLTRRLMAEAWSQEEIGKILGGNVLRVLRQGWGKKH
jgi:membrane dipeptidase